MDSSFNEEMDDLIILSYNNREAFVEETVKFMEKWEDTLVKDKDTPDEVKLDAITFLKNWFISEEKYEQCAVLQRLEDRIKNER